MKKWLLLVGVVCTMSTLSLNAQNVSINRDGALPHSSAVLDITATDAGILIPRMTEAEKNAIASPATGLMVYQTDNSTGFKFYDGSTWTPVSSSLYDFTNQITSLGTLNATTGWKTVPGMSENIVLNADAKIVIWANGAVMCNSSDDQKMASAEVAIYKDGVLINGGAWTRVHANNDEKSKATYTYTPFSLMTVQDLPAGAYNFQMKARRMATHGDSVTPRIGAAATSPRAASMIFQIIYK
ncbi:MAG: hypothetical protein HKO56_03465 [Bacteroidia bacterium]|nr:hypothetical protein [Bacteroidia bacterium]NNM15695.1 hypothetical protein [Bacteroidia bacterium]